MIENTIENLEATIFQIKRVAQKFNNGMEFEDALTAVIHMSNYIERLEIDLERAHRGLGVTEEYWKKEIEKRTIVTNRLELLADTLANICFPHSESNPPYKAEKGSSIRRTCYDALVRVGFWKGVNK